MSKMYAVKNDEGKWLRTDTFGTVYWKDEIYDAERYIEVLNAHHDAKRSDGHVVELVEAPAKVVVPEWFDEWLDAFHGLGPKVRTIAAVGRIAQQGWGSNANVPFLGDRTLDKAVTPTLSVAQLDYVHDNKEELMVAALTGNYTVEKPKRWNVKVPHVDAQEGLWFFVNSDGKVDATYDQDLAQQFALAEIEHYGLQDCERVEVRDEREH
ncbi:DUF1642 domain-containing protein [Lacticaseibacillus suilingensis]|uniref:DUF1642 domain-containing protein n=1 Tax=Lacticaseibacillus suilingensis TaxID=2799577 RepID=UPI0022E6E512|nr:DUF1642 domain-containing protein [Lacticaseibacillus suilingensis]